MQSQLITCPSVQFPPSAFAGSIDKVATERTANSLIVTGIRQKGIQWLIWINILMIALRMFKDPLKAIKHAAELRRTRNRYRGERKLKKYARMGGRYFFNYNAPGWPSKAFDRYITHQLNRLAVLPAITLHTLVFAITKKCGFKCAHCCEWENLNKPEQLSSANLLQIVEKFQDIGISQLQLSGGEPLNRIDDILFLLKNIPQSMDCWLYTTGYQLTAEKAILLKQYGLTGITISVDHYDAAAHDSFRGRKGSFQRSMQACDYAIEAGLLVTFSICATREFISEENLMKYALLAKQQGVSFIQVLEPKAVGHYAGMDVTLSLQQQATLEAFYLKYNYEAIYQSFPIIVYHGYYSRRIGCAGSGKDYLYVDTDGDVHSCPFCQKKLFPVIGSDVKIHIRQMRNAGCGLYNAPVSIK